MGLIYSSSDSSSLINRLKANLNSGKEVTEQLKSGSQKVIAAVDGKTLSGAAYTAGKGLFSELILPTISKVTTAIDNVEQELQQYTAANGKIAGEGNLDEDKLNQQIAIKKAMKASVEASAAVARALSRMNPVANILDSLLNIQKNLNQMADSLEENIRELEDKLEKLREFSAETSGLFTNSLSDMKLAMQGVIVLNSTIVNSDGTYVLPSGVNKSWFTKLQNADKVKKMGEKQKYIKLLQDHFGFDETTATQIFKIKEGLDEKFPKLSQKEKDYLLARILGEFSYSDDLVDVLMWNNTAGHLSDYFYKEVTHYTGEKLKIPKDLKGILSELGLSEKQYKELRYNLRLQHFLSAGNIKVEDLPSEAYKNAKANFEEAYGKISDADFKQFWNQKSIKFNGKGDFTHQSITTATNLYDNNLRLANFSGFSHEHTNELSGWRGDTTTQAEKQPSIGNDDYKADLDAVNITKRMRDKNISYTEASNEYYNDIASWQSNRAIEFKSNTGYDYVKNEILSDLAPKYEYTAGDIKYQTKFEERPDAYNAHTKRDLTEQEKLSHVKEHYPASYDFIESLKNNENEYTNYANKGK